MIKRDIKGICSSGKKCHQSSHMFTARYIHRSSGDALGRHKGRRSLSGCNSWSFSEAYIQ